MSKFIAFIPFFYFQQTRLKGLKDFAFHSVYEWIPAFVILLLDRSVPEALYGLLVYYLAFISLYELGYLLNDQNAINEPEGRTRFHKLNAFSVAIFIAIRLTVFLAITFYTNNITNPFWYCWFTLFSIVFLVHNFLKSAPLKSISFCYLAFARFFSPVIFLANESLISVLVIPVLTNYVLFRLITYMDSKALLSTFDRKSPDFRIGFYVLIIPFSIVTSFFYTTPIPVVMNAYYFIASSFFVLISSKIK
jgi:hypothetical protein